MTTVSLQLLCSHALSLTHIHRHSPWILIYNIIFLQSSTYIAIQVSLNFTHDIRVREGLDPSLPIIITFTLSALSPCMATHLKMGCCSNTPHIQKNWCCNTPASSGVLSVHHQGCNSTLMYKRGGAQPIDDAIMHVITKVAAVLIFEIFILSWLLWWVLSLSVS